MVYTCDRCGQQYDNVVLRKEWNNLRVCPDCYEEKHPQLEPDPPPYEPQALFEPRPDRKESLEILVGQKTFPLINNIYFDILLDNQDLLKHFRSLFPFH